jgi:hypothetical protein
LIKNALRGDDRIVRLAWLLWHRLNIPSSPQSGERISERPTQE